MKIRKRLLFIWIAYMAVCLVIPPLFHRAPQDGGMDLHSPTLSQERILCIDNNMDALLWRLRLIENAQESIVLCTFDFREDNSGGDMMASLFHAAERGVDIRIMVDGINGMLYLTGSRGFRELSAHENVQVKFYNPVNLLIPWRINYRMHDKYMIVDDFAYILGGRNTNDLFLGNYRDSYNEDRDMLVYETMSGQGRSYLQLKGYFEQIWNLPCARPYRKVAYKKEILAERYSVMREKYPEVFTDIQWEDVTMETKAVELYTNPIEPENKQPLLWNKMIDELKKSERILIQTPYVICSRDMYHDLAEISVNGAEIITNAVEGGANPFGCTDYLNQKEEIYKTGVHVYEYLGEQALHTKTILAGDSISMVGSCNLDMRSVYLDTEMMLFIDCEELNQSLRRQASQLKEHSRHISPDGMISDGEAYVPLEQGPMKKLFYEVLRVLVIPFRHLL